MAKILVADDEVDLEMLIKQKFRQKIREKQYEFVFANNGNEALRKLKENPDVDVVLSDINMPEMDGLTLLTKLNEVSPLIKAVIVSAYGDMDNIRTAMNRGALGIGLALLLAAAPAQAGCLKGAVVGGIAGHYAHHHAVLGAIAGCAIGHHMTVEARKQKAAQQRAQQAHHKPQSTHP